MPVKTLIVGGAGYIGSHVTNMLYNLGWDVTVFDNLSHGNAESIPGISIYLGDLRNFEEIDACIEAGRYELIIDLAAFTSVSESVLLPKLYDDNNVRGTSNLLSAMLKHCVNKIIFSSSAAVYGKSEKNELFESDLKQPINPYGETKLKTENELHDFAVNNIIKSISFRYFNAAGADISGLNGERHDPETHLIPLVLNEALRVKNGGNADESKLIIFGNDYDTKDGSCARDYIHVSDIANAHILAAERLINNLCAGDEYYNISSGKATTNFEIIEKCKEITGIPIQYKIKERRPGDPDVLVGNSDLAKTVLNWTPENSDLGNIIESAWIWHQYLDNMY